MGQQPEQLLEQLLEQLPEQLPELPPRLRQPAARGHPQPESIHRVGLSMPM